jgi:hypothetical protein
MIKTEMLDPFAVTGRKKIDISPLHAAILNAVAAFTGGAPPRQRHHARGHQTPEDVLT